MKLELSRRIFKKILKYQITRKSVRWGEPSCSMRTEKETDRQTDVTKIIAALIILRTRLNIWKWKGTVLKIDVVCVIRTGRFLYQCLDLPQLSRDIPKDARFLYNRPCVSGATIKTHLFLHNIKNCYHIVTPCYFLYQDIHVKYQVRSN